MKINDQMPVYNSMASKTKNFSEGFMKLLDEPKHSMQGDDYYVQHQEQLQKSELTFTPLKDPQLQNRIIPCNDKAMLLSKAEQMESTKVASVHFANETLTDASLVEATLAPTDELTLKPITQRVKMESPAPFVTTEQRIEHHEKTTDEQSLTPSSATTPPALKKHHLFVEQQQAEFSVSAYDLKPKEQKQLLKMVKNYLKKKGLSLKKLMINGVSHD